ncbi:MAG: aminotransferase class I/II-fold pyridoxal phosphate-dependent enzyme [Bacteroidota bacterium]
MIDTLNQIVEDGLKRKLVHNYSSIDFEPPNSLIVVDDHEMVNFGSCSYLGLEKHSDLQNGVIDAVKKYGTQFASSRTYISHGLYHELENLIYQIFHKPLIVTASTTLGHLATIPVVVEKNDAIILDLQVHSSIQMTVQQLKARGLPVSIIKHNCMESLESKIQSLYNKHDQIWYFADGVYSMYGDYAPFEQLDKLLLKYEKFNLYIDDAHGMGWDGKNGCGVVFKNMKQIEKMILTVSLNKSFAAAGGCVVFPNKEIEKKVRNCGSTYIFAGPIQPPMLGAAISSAKLHLSEKIESMQANLMELINYTNVRLDELGLPQFQKTHSPLFFIPVGPPKICCDIVSKMKSKGFFMNIASFPAVPIRRSGIRFMINAFLKKKQINEMLTALCGIYSETITENNTTCTQISKTFKIPDFSLNADQNHVKYSSEEKLQTKIYRSIKNLDEKKWDDIFQKNSTLNYANVALIEDVYTNENRLENNWDFYYIDIKDSNDNIILKTLITVVLTKDDMLHSNTVSRKSGSLALGQ